MAGCKLTQSLENKVCEYAVAGIKELYLANYYTPSEGNKSKHNTIAYEFDSDNIITGIHLPVGENFYKINGSNNTMSFTDALLAGGNGGKYRQHTVNAVLNKYDVEVLNEGDALSLGKFIAVVVDQANRIVVLGRTSGLSAPAGGFDYNSGASESDATGWTITLQGISTEISKLVENIDIVTPSHVSIFKADFDTEAHCVGNGNRRASMFKKVSSLTGEPMDIDGELTSVSGKKQAIARLNIFPDLPEYETELRYTGNDGVNGVSAYKKDAKFCVPGKIEIDKNKLDLKKNDTFELESENKWAVLFKDNAIATISLSNGEAGKHNIKVTPGAKKGKFYLMFINKVSHLIAYIEIVNE